MDNVNHMHSHEMLSDSMPLYIYYNCYFYHNLYDHVLNIARISVHVIIIYIAITFIILLQFIYSLESLYTKYFLQSELPLDEFLGPMGSKFEYNYFKEICFPRSLVYP